MGALCGCFHAPNPDDEQSVDGDGVNHGRSCFKKFAELFRGEQVPTLVVPPLPVAAEMLRYDAAVNNTTNTATNPPTTLRIESNSETFISQQVVLGAGAAREQLIRGDDSVREFFDGENTLDQPQSDEKLKQNLLNLSPEDERLCSICLEEFTTENPEAVLQCTHCYHLGCTYEWMERSPNCPICAQVMLFDETSFEVAKPPRTED